MINKEKFKNSIETLLEEHKTASVQMAIIKDGKIICAMVGLEPVLKEGIEFIKIEK